MLRTRVAFRVDASDKIGSGHFMRCLTLAQELKKQEIQIAFISRHMPQHLTEMIIDQGMEFLPITSIGSAEYSLDQLAHSSWLGVSQEQDSQDTLAALSDKDWDWIVVDHYALDFRWENLLRSRTNRIMVIDDIADRQHSCDVLLDQNYYLDKESRYKDKVSKDCLFLLGPYYSLLRDEFRVYRVNVESRRRVNLKRIFIFFGGVDAENMTTLAVNALAELNYGFEVDVVIGFQHPYRSTIEDACAIHGYHCHLQTTRMAELMSLADLSIGAGGSATWERCSLGLPSIVVSVANNQVRASEDLSYLGAIKYIGTSANISASAIKLAVENALGDEWIDNASQKCMSLVDAQGVLRVTNVMRNFYE